MVIVSFLLFFASCKKSIPITENTLLEQKNKKANESTISSSNISVNWNNWPNDVNYTVAMATADFGHVNNFQQVEQARTSISLSRLRVTLLENEIGAAGGVINYSNIDSHSGYELNYKMKFASNFDFATAGYFGFGLGIGDGLLAAPDGEGAGFRMRWKKDTNGDVYIHPYLNYADQNGPNDNDFGVRYPATGSIQGGVYYNIKMVFKANTKMNKNGRAEVYVNNVQVLNVPIRWTKNHEKRKANTILFENYRVGSASSTYGKLWFDDFTLAYVHASYTPTWCDNVYTHAKMFDLESATYYDLTTINTAGITLRNGLADNSMGETGTDFARRVDCCVAFNGSQGTAPPGQVMDPIGIQLIDGNIVQELPTNHHTLGIKAGNQLLSYSPGSTAISIKNDGAVFALSAFRPIIENHQAITLPPNNGEGQYAKNPRQVIAQYDDGRIVVLSCGGRGYGGEGMTYPEFTRILTALDVKFAFVLDGGGSTTMILNGERVTPLIDGNGTQERVRANWLYIKNQ